MEMYTVPYQINFPEILNRTYRTKNGSSMVWILLKLLLSDVRFFHFLLARNCVKISTVFLKFCGRCAKFREFQTPYILTLMFVVLPLDILSERCGE